MELQQISDALLRRGCRQAQRALPAKAGEQLCHELQHDLAAAKAVPVAFRPLPVGRIMLAAVLVVLLCLAGYLLTPRPAAVWSERQRLADPLSAFTAEEKSERQLAELKRKIRETPQDSVLWATLGEYYLYHNAWRDSLLAYHQALKLRGENAQLYAALATVLYWQAGQTITAETQQWIDRALALDADEVTALMLLAADAFMHSDYSRAVKIWQRLLDSGSPRVDRARLIEAINMANLLQNQQK